MRRGARPAPEAVSLQGLPVRTPVGAVGSMSDEAQTVENTTTEDNDADVHDPATAMEEAGTGTILPRTQRPAMLTRKPLSIESVPARLRPSVMAWPSE
jgi:hypothetical protein